MLLFGPAAMALDKDRAILRVRPDITCQHLLAALGAEFPALAPFAATGVGRLAINRTFATPQQLVQPTDEIALIALVSGG